MLPSPLHVPALGTHTLTGASSRAAQFAQSVQLLVLPHSVAQNFTPSSPPMQCSGLPSGAAGQSTSDLQGAQNSRGKQTFRVLPKLCFVVSTFGESLTVAQYQ